MVALVTGAESARRYRANHPEVRMAYNRTPERKARHRARVAVYRALRRGDLLRQPCGVCGEAKTEAHHVAGYERDAYLKVAWFCRSHHNEIHGRGPRLFCKAGHPQTPGNVYHSLGRQDICRLCRKGRREALRTAA